MVRVATFFLLVCVSLSSAIGQEPPRLALPIYGLKSYLNETVTSICANVPQKRLYVGMLSRDPKRSGLWVFTLDDQLQPIGDPRKYADHPDTLPPDTYSVVKCMLHDPKTKKLYLGIHSVAASHARSLVTISLDAAGDPIGKPDAFDHGNPHKAADSLCFHPTNNKLYVSGWGGEGVFLLDRDDQGGITGTPSWQKFGPYGGASVAIRSDGKRLYRGTYPSTLDVCALDAAGNISGPAKSFSIPNGPMEYLQFAATDKAIYVRGADGKLSWFALDAQGDVQGELRSSDIPDLQAVAAGTTPDRLLIAVAKKFNDAVTSAPVIGGFEVREVALKADGGVGETLRTSDPSRGAAIFMAGGSQAALAAKPLPYGFLGNRFAGLQARCSIVSIDAEGAPLPALFPVALGDESVYLRFAVSEKFGRVYAAANEKVHTTDLKHIVQTWPGFPTGRARPTVEPDAIRRQATAQVDSPTASGAIAVDEQRGQLYAALKDGSIAVHKLDASGVPQGRSEVLKTTLTYVNRLIVHPKSGLVLAAGLGDVTKPAGDASPRVVNIPAGGHVADAVLDIARGRLYVVGAYNELKNTSIWKLDEQGRLASAEATWLADTMPTSKPGLRGMLSSVRLDEEARRLIVVGSEENPAGPPSWYLVWKLDAQGDALGEATRIATADPRGSPYTFATAGDGQTLYASGWGDAAIFQHVRAKDWSKLDPPARLAAGNYGKRQLEVVSIDGQNVLLAGTYPSQLEVIPLSPTFQPVPSAMAELTVETFSKKLGHLTAGEWSPWVNLDDALKNTFGRAVVRCNLTGTTVKRAVVRWEIAKKSGERLEPVRSVDVTIAGSVAGLVVPRYGLDEAGPGEAATLKSLVKTSAEEFAEYKKIAERYRVSAAERPLQFIVANGLIGIDSSEEALNLGLEALTLLGHNNAQIWNFPGMSPQAIRAAADRHGIRSFREAIYNPPSYFHYNTELVSDAYLDKWASGFRENAARMGAKPEELTLMHIGDEPGWYYPHQMDEVAGDPKRLAVFHEYLKSKGITPADVGAAEWKTVVPAKLSEATSLPKKRLLYWTARFYTESLSLGFAAATRSLERNVNPKILTTTNLNNWPGRYFYPSPGQKIANNSDGGPNAAMAMPDWFDLGRKRAVTCIWTEDWFGDADAQQWSMYGDLLRCAARESGIEYGGYPIGQSTGAFVDGGKLKIMALAGHGGKVIDPYIFGPNLAFSDGWTEKEVTYRNLADAIRTLGKADEFLTPARPRDGTVAIVLPQASQVWDPGSLVYAYMQELYGLHAALTHENYPIDFVDDYGIEAGDLAKRKYACVYVSAPNLSRTAQQKLVDFATAGGTIVLLPGACVADEYNEPLDLLRSKLGVKQAAVERMAPPHHSQAPNAARVELKVAEAGIGVTSSMAISQTIPLADVAAGSKTAATFVDGKAAVVETSLGQGRLIAYGFWPGVTYWLSPDRTDYRVLTHSWSAEARRMVTWPAESAKARRPVLVSHPGVEACLLDGPKAKAIVVLNWTGKPIEKLTLSIANDGGLKSATSVERGSLELKRAADRALVEIPLGTVDVVRLE